MKRDIGIGKSGLVLTMIVALAMTILVLLFRPVDIVAEPYGVCLPSPNQWELPFFLSWLINTLLIGVVTLILYLLNRGFNFVRTTEPALPAIFLLLTCSTPWCSQGLNTSTILCLVYVVSLGVIFNTYSVKNATQQLFVIGAIIGLGSMFQYAFVPMMFIVILWALFMKVFRLKEILAFFIGILCPYWIALGLGLIEFSDFRFPSIVPLFDNDHNHSDIILLIAQVGLAAAFGFILWIANSMKLYAGNSKVNAMNLCIASTGVAAIICMLVDYENLPAYIMILYMAVAVQLSNLCALWHIREQWLVTAIPGLVYILLFVGTLVL